MPASVVRPTTQLPRPLRSSAAVAAFNLRSMSIGQVSWFCLETRQLNRSYTLKMELPNSELDQDELAQLLRACASYRPFTLQRVFDKETCSHRWLLILER